MDQKIFIKNTLTKLRKSSNFAYQRAKERNIKNPQTHAKHKDIQNKRKELSNDRFMEYLKALQEVDND